MLTSERFLSSKIEVCADLYRDAGFTILDVPCLEESTLEGILRNCGAFDDWIQRDSVGGLGDHAHFDVLDGPRTRAVAPALFGFYELAVPVVSRIVGREVIVSPYARSGVNIRRYRTGDAEGLHCDTQPISVLMFLTEGAPLEIETKWGDALIDPIPNRVAVFHGREMPHRVRAPEGEQCRIVAPLNYYFPDDIERPDWIDKLIYENVPYGQG